jgi:hypothetical protein
MRGRGRNRHIFVWFSDTLEGTRTIGQSTDYVTHMEYTLMYEDETTARL